MTFALQNIGSVVFVSSHLLLTWRNVENEQRHMTRKMIWKKKNACDEIKIAEITNGLVSLIKIDHIF